MIPIVCLAAWLRLGALCAVAAMAAPAQAADQTEAFMPKGGRTLLIETLGREPDIEEFREIARAQRSDDQWSEFVASRARALPAREAQTLAAYLSVNLPLPAATLQRVQKSADIAAALPRDGRDLAWNECQYCHSLFTSHLTQNRDVQGWRSVFLSPFHRGMKMTSQQREEFARYSAINMPMKVDDVPQDLRF